MEILSVHSRNKLLRFCHFVFKHRIAKLIISVKNMNCFLIKLYYCTNCLMSVQVLPSLLNFYQTWLPVERRLAAFALNIMLMAHCFKQKLLIVFAQHWTECISHISTMCFQIICKHCVAPGIGICWIFLSYWLLVCHISTFEEKTWDLHRFGQCH